MARPHVKQWVVSKAKSEEFIAEKTHFNWELVTQIPTKGRDGVFTITMKREAKPELRKIKIMEKQHKKLKRKLPISCFVEFILAAGCFVAFYMLSQFIWNEAFLILGCILAAVGLFNLIIYLVTLPHAKEFRKILEDECDELGGRHKDTRFAGNVKEATPDTNLIKNNLTFILEKKK